MAQANLLLDEEDGIDENTLYLNFYQGNRQFLNQVFFHQIPYYLKRKIAANFYWTAEDKDDWIGALEDLGVDQTTIYDIDFKSRTIGKFPIYLAINGILQSNNTSLGDFIDVLCKIGKFHILRILKPFVEELLSKRHALNEEEHYSEPHPSAPNYSSLEVTSSFVDSCGSDLNYSAQDTGYDSVSCQEIKERQIKGHKTELENFQNSEATSFYNNKQLYAVSNSLNVNQSVDELISVFIMHSMLDKKYAKKLAARLKENNFRVLTSANIYHLLVENPIQIMKAVDEQADFVVPVLSESFMEQIKFRGYNATDEKDIESIANNFLYKRLSTECSLHDFNRRVRPVRYSKKIRELDERDEILSWSAYLPYSDLKNDEVLENEFLRRLICYKKRPKLSK